MELEYFKPKIPNEEKLHFGILRTDDMSDMTRYYADPSILNRTVRKGLRVFGDNSLVFLDCMKDCPEELVGKEDQVTWKDIMVKTTLQRGSIKAGLEIFISPVNGLNYYFVARIDNDGKREWKKRNEKSSFYPFNEKNRLRVLEIQETCLEDEVLIEIFDPKDDQFRSIRVAFDWQELIKFSNSTRVILRYDGILTRLLRMHSLRTNVTSVSVI